MFKNNGSKNFDRYLNTCKRKKQFLSIFYKKITRLASGDLMKTSSSIKERGSSLLPRRRVVPRQRGRSQYSVFSLRPSRQA